MNNHHIGNNIDHYGDGYMEQEEEWEREGLLDPAWEKQQKKVCFLLFELKVSDFLKRRDNFKLQNIFCQ